MGRMAWDLMRGVDVLLKQPAIDKERIVLIGAVAGGGDPTGVAAALDARIACVVPFNFGGWQPESGALDNPDRDFAWFGEGYWESTRGLKDGARDGFAHFAIVGSVAPRKVVYAHEFAWDAKTDPAWPRLRKIFAVYDAEDSLKVAHGAGAVRSSGGGNTHCDHVGAAHRKMIHPALKEWFGMPVPEEYSKRRPGAELACWTEEMRKKLATEASAPAQEFAVRKPVDDEARAAARKAWAKSLGPVEPPDDPEAVEGKGGEAPGGSQTKYLLEPEPGVFVPVLLLTRRMRRAGCPSWRWWRRRARPRS